MFRQHRQAFRQNLARDEQVCKRVLDQDLGRVKMVCPGPAAVGPAENASGTVGGIVISHAPNSTRANVVIERVYWNPPANANC